MLLQCEIDGDGWLRANTLQCLAELNEGCLALIAAQAQVTHGNALLEQFGGEWQLLESAGRRRAAGCMYLLLDAGFALPQRWQAERDPLPVALHEARFFSVPGSAGLAHEVLVFAWHLCRCEPAAARLLLGMPAACVALLAAATLGQVRTLAAAHPQWLKPRWLGRPRMWREFLAAARTDDAATLERARAAWPDPAGSRVAGGNPCTHAAPGDDAAAGPDPDSASDGTRASRRRGVASVDRDLAAAAGIACAAEHAVAAEVHDDPAGVVDGDHAAVAAEAAQDLVQHLVHGLRQRDATVLDRGADVVGRHCADEVLPVPGGRDRADPVLRVGAGADDRRVADASGALVGHAAGGGRRGEIAGGVARHRPDGAARGGPA